MVGSLMNTTSWSTSGRLEEVLKTNLQQKHSHCAERQKEQTIQPWFLRVVQNSCATRRPVATNISDAMIRIANGLY